MLAGFLSMVKKIAAVKNSGLEYILQSLASGINR
jgi:hypothetical protein